MLLKFPGSLFQSFSNLVSRSQVNDNRKYLEESKRVLFSLVSSCKNNGVTCDPETRILIHEQLVTLETLIPTRSPARSDLNSGFWRLVYSNSPAGLNTGKIGPIWGKVYQDLKPEKKFIKNLLVIENSWIRLGLFGDQSIESDQVW